MAIKKGNNLANTLFGTNLADQLFGLGANDILFGFAGNDLLDGGTGADRMAGGLGNDIYAVDNAGDVVIEGFNQGVDTVRSTITLTLGANVENLTILGTAARNGTGNTLNNVIIGNNAFNVLVGSDGNDVLSGNGSADQLFGGEGHDTLLPGQGTAHFVNGGNGFDTIDYRDAEGAVQVWLALGVFEMAANGDGVGQVESVTGSRFNDSLMASATEHSNAFGNDGNDRILGSSANFDRLRGDNGHDTLVGAGGGSSEDFWLQYNRGFDFVVNYRQSGDDHVFIVGSEFGLGTNPNNFIATAEFGSGDVQGVPQFTGIQKLFYETTTGILWGDKDGGAGPGAPIIIAIFAQGSVGPTAADIFVV